MTGPVKDGMVDAGPVHVPGRMNEIWMRQARACVRACVLGLCLCLFVGRRCRCTGRSRARLAMTPVRTVAMKEATTLEFGHRLGRARGRTSEATDDAEW